MTNACPLKRGQSERRTQVASCNRVCVAQGAEAWRGNDMKFMGIKDIMSKFRETLVGALRHPLLPSLFSWHGVNRRRVDVAISLRYNTFNNIVSLVCFNERQPHLKMRRSWVSRQTVRVSSVRPYIPDR